MPSLFRRKPTELVEESVADAEQEQAAGSHPSKGRTPSKRELGVATPKRQNAQARRVEPPPANRREAYKRMRERQRAERVEQRAGMASGDEKFMLARDRGPERALARDVIDSRRTVGTFFFGGALVVLLGSSNAMPAPVRLAANLLWTGLAVGVTVDSFLFCRKIRKLMQERFPKTAVPKSLYFYAITRGLTFRRMRTPKPRVKIGDKV